MKYRNGVTTILSAFMLFLILESYREHVFCESMVHLSEKTSESGVFHGYETYTEASSPIKQDYRKIVDFYNVPQKDTVIVKLIESHFGVKFEAIDDTFKYSFDEKYEYTLRYMDNRRDFKTVQLKILKK